MGVALFDHALLSGKMSPPPPNLETQVTALARNKGWILKASMKRSFKTFWKCQRVNAMVAPTPVMAALLFKTKS